MLIKCTECSKEISDKATSCPHCGCPILVEGSIDKPQQVEITSVNIKPRNPRKNKIILIAIATLFVIGVVAVSFFTIKTMKEEKRARDLYLIILKAVDSSLSFGADQSESLCNLTEKVWYNTIHDEFDSETGIFRLDGDLITDDFNIALSNLYSSETAKTYITFIESSQRITVASMKDLSNPSEEFKKCYEALEELYPVYKSLTDLAINPTGSLQSYTDSKNDKIDEFSKLYNKFKLQLPEFDDESTPSE